MLRKTRQVLAILFFTAITLLFLDFTGAVHTWFGWMANIQFLPAVLALNAGVIVLLIVITLVFGRIYCSIICPLGVPGYRVMDKRAQEKEEIPLLMVTCKIVAAIRSARTVRHRPDSRSRFFRGLARPLQLIRTHPQSLKGVSYYNICRF